MSSSLRWSPILGIAFLCCSPATTVQDSGASRDGSSDASSDGSSVVARDSSADVSSDVAVTVGVTVRISPNVVALAPNAMQTFNCTVTGTTNTACSWRVTEATGGMVTAAGVYSAPAAGGGYHVVATSVADPSKNDTATVTVVAPCSGLSGTIGQWQNISPSAFTMPANMETLSVVVNPQDSTVFAAAGNATSGGSSGTGVFKSSDCGATWARVSGTASGTDSANLLTGDPWAMLLDRQHPQTMYINNGYGSNPTIYKSTNGGVDWSALNPDPTHRLAGDLFVQSIAMDPVNDNHLAVSFHVGCGPTGGPYTWCFSQSTDAGASWTVFAGPTSVPGFMVSDAGWVESASISILGPSSYIVLSPSGVYYTGDTGQTWTLVMAYIDSTSYAGSTYIGADGTLYIGDGSGPLYYSAPAPGHDPPFAIYQAPSLPVPQPRLPYQSGLEPAVTPLMNAPQVTQLVDDGVSFYAANNLSTGGLQFWTARISDPTHWTQMSDTICANNVCRGSNEMAYDSVNHIVYSANWGSGLWRLVTR